MILQNMVLIPQDSRTEELYWKGNASKDGIGLRIYAGQELDLRTYFQLFSTQKWKKYTELENICIEMTCMGEAELIIEQLAQHGNNIGRTLEWRIEDISQKELGDVQSEDFTLPDTDILGVRIKAKKDFYIESIGWGTRQNLQQLDVHLGLGICTFKREEYVQRNIEKLKKDILENQDALSYGKVSVCVSDNAATLDASRIESDDVRVVVNKNMGGVGGFTRTMLELQKDPSITHIVLMDDDVVIEPEAIERTYTLCSLLRKEYRQFILGGALMRLDQPYTQYENGAMWNDGDMIAHNHNFQMDELLQCIKNETEQKADYTGWWYTCIPVEFIRQKELPLPLFIHRDDIEYGLRADAKFLTLNGICVWHEAFENKCPGVNEYYDVRNLAIINSIHEPEYSAKEFKKMLLKQISSNIGKYRYQYVDLNLMGALDFLKGFQWFRTQDTLEIHKNLAKYNYELKDKEVYVGYKHLAMEDFELYGKKTERKVGRIEKLLKMSTMNGHFLPGKGNKPKIAIPYPNIYDLYRYKEVIYVDSNDKCLYTRKSVIELIKAYIKYLKVCRIINRKYDAVSKEYRASYHQVTSETYWKQYLGIE